MTLSERQRRSNRLYLANQDMEEAQHYLFAHHEVEQLALAGHGDHLHHGQNGLMLSAIVAYARPFVRSDSAGQADAKIDAAGMFDGHPNLQALHDEIVSRRHKAAAHADWEHHRTELIEDGGPAGSSLRMVRRPHYGQGIDNDEFLQLIHFCQRLFIGESLDLDDAIRAEESASLRQFLYRRKESNQ